MAGNREMTGMGEILSSFGPCHPEGRLAGGAAVGCKSLLLREETPRVSAILYRRLRRVK